MTSAGGRKDPTWKYTSLPIEGDTNTHKCVFCGKVTHGGISRQKEHLIGTTRKRKNVSLCMKVSEDVKDELKAYQEGVVEKRKQQNLIDLIPDFDEEMDPDDDEVQFAQSKRKGKAVMATSSKASNAISLSSQRKRGPMDAFVHLNPESEVAKDERSKKLRQSVIPEAFNKERRDETWQNIARWFYQAGIPFNTARLKSFKVMIKSIGLYGPGLQPPSYHQLRVPLLQKEVEATKNMVEFHKEVWRVKGCSLMSDGWSDRKDRTLINFLVNSPYGTVFIESVDASSHIKTGEKMFELLDKMMQRIGGDNVIQVITDNASNLKLAGKYLEAKWPHLYWTPCAAHCLDLMLEDIGKLPTAKRTLKRAIALTGFIYGHGYVLNMMREFTKDRELLRPGMTRFCTSFLTLASIYKLKKELRMMFCSEKWTTSRWAKEPKGKNAQSTVLMTVFWNDVAYVLRATSPLVRVLRLVDSEKKPAMGYIYEAMDRAKESIKLAFNGNEVKYGPIWEIVDRRWEVQLHRPLHAAGYFLNPEFFYDNPNINSDEEVMKGLYDVIERLIPEREIQDAIDRELSVYRQAAGLFGINMAIRNRKTKSPADWWESYGGSAPNLQKLAIKVLSLTCSASGCERNWSMFEHIHSKKRNNLEHKRLNDLVYIKYNQALRERFESKDIIDPISLKDIDESNEWLVGRMDDEDADNELFDDDLTWGNIATAAGVREPSVYTRRATRGAHTGSSSSRGAGRRQRDDIEEESASEDESEDEEENIEGLESDEDENPDDDPIHDLDDDDE